MKFSLYIAGLAFIIVSCSTTRNFSSIMEDDIYYVPGKKALAIREVENLTGHDIGTEQPVDPTVLAGEISRSAGSSTPPATFSSSNNTKINARSGQLEQVNIQSLTREAEEKLANNEEIDMTLYENTGYWIGGYRGPASDLAEIQRIINMYPEGFANFSNGQEIALNLSFDSDWNVYTDNGRYWWFPSNTNINLYSSLLFGTYPKYIWTIVWNNPRFDSWAFDATFNNRFNWSLNLGWGGPGLEHRIRMEFRLVRSLVRRLVRSLVSPLVRWLLSGMGLSTLASPTLGTSRLGLSALGRWKRSLSQQAQPASLGRTTAWIRRRSKRHTPKRKSAQQQQWVEPPEQHPSGYRKCVTPGHQQLFTARNRNNHPSGQFNRND